MSVSDIVDDLKVEFPDAPLSAIRDSIMRVGRNMAADTYCYRVFDEPVVVAANSRYPEIESPLGTEPVAIVSLKIDGHDASPGVHFTQTTPTSVQFRSPPNDTVLYGVLAVRPKHGTMLPEELITKYQDCIMHGVRADLFKMPRQPWTDMQMNQLYARYYSAEKGNVKRDVAMGLQGGTHLMKFPNNF